MELNDNYPKEHLQGLYNMQKQDQLCDVTIHVGGRKFRAHKTVLAATGHYFLTMFTSGFKESSAQEVTIEGSAAAFEILLNFVYTGGVKRTKVASCISEVLEMACYMQFTEFVDTCCAAIQKLLNAKKEAASLSDVCKVMMLAQTHDLTPLYQATLRYFEDKVESLKCLDTFLENNSATSFLQDFLCQENLSNADEEEHVLELVINWLKHDWEKRKEHSHQLLQKVRLGLVAPEDIKKLIGPEILDIPGCSELVNRALDLLGSNKTKEILAIENPDIAAARSTIMAPVILNQGEVKYYDVKHKEWTTMNKMDPLPSKSKDNIYELILVKGVLYAAGGTSGREFLKYQTSENKWVPLSSKPLGRKRIKLVALGAYIYAFGVCCEYVELHQKIERYDISAEKWEVLKVQDSSGFGRYNLIADEVMDTTWHRGNCECMEYCAARAQARTEDKERCEMFAVAFEGRIFMSILKQEESDNTEYDHEEGVHHSLYCLNRELVILDPGMNTYEVQDFGEECAEDEHGEWDNECFKPILFIYEDQLHWMIAYINKADSYSYYYVTVKRLSVTQEEDGNTTVGYSGVELQLLHDFPPDFPDEENAPPPFYIQDYIKQSGTAGSKTTGHSKVKSLPQYEENKQLTFAHESDEESDRDLVYPVWFSFEKKLTQLNRK